MVRSTTLALAAGVVLLLISCVGCGAAMPEHVRAGSVTLTTAGASTSRGFVDVPARVGAPASRLAVAVHWADRRPKLSRPALFVGPGGPGLPETDMVLHAERYLSSRLLAHYNVVGLDVRGSGRSEPHVDCGGQAASKRVLFTPVWEDQRSDVAQVRTAARTFARSCGRLSGAVLPALTMADNVEDHDAVRVALGLNRVDVLGLSQSGSVALQWAASSPHHVARVVADGSADPSRSAFETSLDQARGMQRQLQRFEAWCDARRCMAGAGTKAAIARLLVAADEPTGPTSGMVLTAIIQGLYSDQAFARLGTALRRAAAGDDRQLAAFAAYSLGGPHDVESFYGYACMEPGARTAARQSSREVQEITAVAPDLWRFFSRDQVCDYWPVTARSASRWRPGDVRGAVLLIGSRHDPVTGYEQIRALHEEIATSTLLTTTGDRHTSYLSDSCVRDRVDDFLLAGEAADHAC